MAQAGGPTSGPVDTIPLFTPMLPPMIESVSHEALVKWQRERRDYEAKLLARCRMSGEDFDAVVQTVRDSFEPTLLDVFCEMQLGVNSVDATEGMLISEIAHIVGRVKNDALPDMEDLFKRELRMDMGESDVNARLMDYFKAFNNLAKDYGLAECFASTHGIKQRCKLLIDNLLPNSLKDEVKQCIRFTDVDAAKDPKLLFRLTLKKTTELERQHQRLRQQKRDAKGPDKEKPRLEQTKKPKRQWESRRPAAAATTEDPRPAARTSSSRPGSKPAAGRSQRPPPGPCPKCQELHRLRECPTATPKEREELWKQMRDAKQSKRVKLKRLGEVLPTIERVVTLNGKLELPYCPDSGSDYTVIGRSHWEELKEVDPTVEVVELDTPILNQAFGSTTVTAKSKAKLRVMIHTAVGPVEPMGAVDVLVVDADDGEFIIGNDLLTSLGIDVGRQLEQLATRCDDETSGDPIELEADEMPVR